MKRYINMKNILYTLCMLVKCQKYIEKRKTEVNCAYNSLTITPGDYDFPVGIQSWSIGEW